MTFLLVASSSYCIVTIIVIHHHRHRDHHHHGDHHASPTSSSVTPSASASSSSSRSSSAFAPKQKVERRLVEHCVGLLAWLSGGAHWRKPWLQCLYKILHKLFRSLSCGNSLPCSPTSQPTCHCAQPCTLVICSVVGNFTQ